jgi:hypothetical protein
MSVTLMSSWCQLLMPSWCDNDIKSMSVTYIFSWCQVLHAMSSWHQWLRSQFSVFYTWHLVVGVSDIDNQIGVSHFNVRLTTSFCLVSSSCHSWWTWITREQTYVMKFLEMFWSFAWKATSSRWINQYVLCYCTKWRMVFDLEWNASNFADCIL